MNDDQAMADERLPTRRPQDLRARTKAFALRILRLYAALDKTSIEAQVIGKQMLRSGTSVGAHYREAHRARSTPEFISKLEVGLQELDETSYWLELLVEGQIVPESRLADLCKEIQELTAILVSSVKTAKQHQTKGRT
ncbi:MAG: four helix bundle protein [Gemmataceae bacterium]|nr:four helix bundle protein [Gemmataceae bacterium]